MIEIREVRKSFGDTEILKGLSAKFNEGEINLIIGESGSGKTVLLKSLLGLLEVTSGNILFNNY